MENALTMDQPSLTPAYPGANGTSLPGAVRLLTLAEVSPADRHAWHDLGTDAADKNAFADPELVIAGLTHVSSGDVRLAFVNARGGQLIGVAPLVIATQLGRFPLRHIRLWDHPNSFCTAVLIREGHGHAFWSILFAALAADPGWARSCAVALPMLPYDSQAFESLSRVAAARNWRLQSSKTMPAPSPKGPNRWTAIGTLMSGQKSARKSVANRPGSRNWAR